MYDAGETVAAITRKLRLTRRIVDKQVLYQAPLITTHGQDSRMRR